MGFLVRVSEIFARGFFRSLGYLGALMVLVTALPLAFADTPSTEGSIGIDMTTEPFEPRCFMHPNRTIYHNNANNGTELVERIENYAFEGEKIKWLIVCWDKNGDDKIADVYVTLNPDGQQPGDGDIEANCDELAEFPNGTEFSQFNARELEENLTFNDETMNIYQCTLTVETFESMYGEYFVTVEAVDLDGINFGTMDENEYWFFNPEIAITVTGTVDFGEVRPGSNAYSDTILIGNDADAGSGVLLNMFISGTDFFDPASSGAKCPTSNELKLDRLAYFATNGNYETKPATPRTNLIGGGTEGYYWIPYENGNEDSPYPGDDDIFGRQPIIEKDGTLTFGGKSYWAGNVLSPGAEIAITFRLALPEPCNGDFTDGEISFWGEAI